MTPRGASAWLFCAGVLAGALVGEVAVRILAALGTDLGKEIAHWDPAAILIQPVGELGYRQKPLSTYEYENGTRATSNAQAFRGPVVKVPKPPGTFRIELLGGSTTHGWGVDDDETIDAFMRQFLSARYPDRRFDVVNLGFDGYDSYQDWNRFETDGIALDPDVVIVNSGINDVRNARFPDLTDHDLRTLIWEADLHRLRLERQRGGPTVWTRIKHYSYLARLGGIARRAIETQGARMTVPAAVPNSRAADYFGRNLRRVGDLAAAHHIAALFSTPPSALNSRYAPNATSDRAYWLGDAATTEQYRDTLAARMRSLVDTLRSEHEAVAYVPHRLSPDMFLDDCHLTAAGNRQMALDFVAALAPVLSLGGSASGPPQSAPRTATGGR